MQPNISLDRTIIATQIDEVVNIMLELTAPPAVAIERAPLDVVVVLDRSGSMSGAPLAAVMAATEQLLRLAGPEDRIGVVAFASDVRLILPLAQHDPASAGPTVRRITTGGSTNLSGGWLKALELLTSDVRAGALRRIIVLTDGHANAGISDAEQLAGLVGSGHTQGVTTSCIGFADGYDEQLLANLADAGHGNDYWCAGPDQATQVFADEFGGLASVVAQNISVEITPTAAVATSAVLNEFPITDLPGGGVQIAIGDAYGSEKRRVVARFHLRPIQGEGAVDVAAITLRWASTVDTVSLHTVTLPVTVTAGSDPAVPDPGADPRVHEEVLVLEAARRQREARDAAEAGDHDTAADLLRSSVSLLMSTASPDMSLVSELRSDALQLDEGRWSAAQSKKHFSRSRSTSKGRRSNYEDPFAQGDPGEPI